MAGATTRRKLVPLGIVGTGPLWDSHYREALRRLAQRVTIRGVYDAVPARAEQTAREWHAMVAPSLTSLFERPDLEGILILDSAWLGLFPLELACRFTKPTLVSGRWEGDLARHEQLYLSARDAGATVITAFPRRHTPASNRLRELIATKLGSPLAVRAVAVAEIAGESVDIHQLTGLLDWCAYVVGKSPRLVSAGPTRDGIRIGLEFPSPLGTSGATAEIVLQKSPPGSPTTACETLHVDCQHGVADVTGDADIFWQIGADAVKDDLTSERSSTDILLDQFCRRVVGGLVPVSDLSDALRALRLADTVLTQLGTGTPSASDT